MAEARMRIGEVAERTGLSLRTIRHYEEVGLVTPSARSKGGFRLYTATDVDRLMVVRRMKPLDFTLDEMRELLEVTDRLSDPRRPPAEDETRQLRARLEDYHAAALSRVEKLRTRLAMAEEFAATLHDRLS
ncbi:MerR family transcriptional regulator [Streptomyces sp. NPDC003077]|uniref:MerR family transcriptional regulator n=1 Tax=Streptomyces sp. NPDC003077 TaxID=3154443 RepID=UPI00339F71B7